MAGMVYFPNVSIGWDNNARYPTHESKRVVSKVFGVPGTKR